MKAPRRSSDSRRRCCARCRLCWRSASVFLKPEYFVLLYTDEVGSKFLTYAIVSELDRHSDHPQDRESEF